MGITTSIESEIQEDLASILQEAPLNNIPTSSVGIIREAPQISEVINQVPCVLICPRGPNKTPPNDFEGGVFREYVQEIIVIAGREGDLSTYQDPTQAWHETCVQYVQTQQSFDANPGLPRLTLPTATTVYDIQVGDIPTFERSKLAKNYAYLSFFVTVRSSE